MKQTVEIDIPDGWEFDRVGTPTKGDTILSNNGYVQLTYDWCNCSAIILRKRHVWPDWLKPGWITVDKKDAVEWWQHEPDPSSIRGLWLPRLGAYFRIDLATNITVPPYDDWMQAKWRVP